MPVVKIICENNGAELSVNMGTALHEVINFLALRNPQPFLAAYVNNRIKELDYKIYKPVSIRFIDITHFEGICVYQRTLFFIMHKAVHDLYPDATFSIRHSVSKGFYCEIDNQDELSDKQIAQIKQRMDEIIAADIPIVRERLFASEVENIYSKLGFDDKIALLRTRPRL